MDKIDIAIIDMKYQRMLDVSSGFIEINENYLRYRASFKTDEPKDKDDLMLGDEECEYDWDLYIKKSCISSVELELGTPLEYERHWLLSICPTGRAEDIRIYFKEDSKAQAEYLKDKLVNWLFK